MKEANQEPPTELLEMARFAPSSRSGGGYGGGHGGRSGGGGYGGGGGRGGGRY
jgi:hypothetical protein